jgi:ribosome maturation factor RimP
MITEKVIRTFVEENLGSTDLFVVDVSIRPVNIIKVEIDSYEGVKIEDCTRLNRLISKNFDREEEDYELQVSSPGLDQPFKIIKQYEKNVGREVEVLKKEGVKISGKLLEANADWIVLEVSSKVKDEKSKKKKNVIVRQELPLSEIKETKIVISFK